MVIYVRLCIFLFRHNILFSNWFGFGISHSTDTTVLKFVDNLTHNIDHMFSTGVKFTHIGNLVFSGDEL